MHGRRDFLIGAAAWSAAGAAYAAGPSLGDILGAAARDGGSLSEGDASSGIKAALTNGIMFATTRLGKLNGFYEDGRVHIPLPGPLGKTQKALKPLGMSAPFDDVELKMNRAAEASMPTAKKLFLSAVQSITISDAVGIVRGGDTAGTQFLRGRTEPDLTRLLRPRMQTTLQTTGAFGALDRATASTGSLGPLAGALGGGGSLGGNLKGQIIDFAVKKALDGAFGYIGDEEANIRRDPLKQSSAILRKVFG